MVETGILQLHLKGHVHYSLEASFTRNTYETVQCCVPSALSVSLIHEPGEAIQCTACRTCVGGTGCPWPQAAPLLLVHQNMKFKARWG